MSLPDPSVLDRFHRVLVEEIRSSRPEYVDGPFTVAEIYQHLVPYRTHRDAIGVEINGDYEDALLRLLAGEGDYLVLESQPALRQIREELEGSNPDTSLYRDFAAVDVRLNPEKLDVAPPFREEEIDPGVEPDPEADPGPPPAPRYNLDEPVPTWDARSTPAVREAAVGEATEDGPGEQPSGDTEAAACRGCGERLPPRDDLAFCPFCGMDQRVVVCDGCGETLEPEWRYCIGCGQETGS